MEHRGHGAAVARSSALLSVRGVGRPFVGLRGILLAQTSLSIQERFVFQEFSNDAVALAHRAEERERERNAAARVALSFFFERRDEREALEKKARPTQTRARIGERTTREGEGHG